MASDESFVQFIAEQIQNAGAVRYRKMFGEYALYCNDKVVALICDNQLFLKPTNAGKAYLGEVIEAPAYPGAKPSFLIDERFEDSEWLSKLIQLTEKALPAPAKKKKKRK